MWELPVPVWEKVLRAAAVYAFLLLAMRLTGKRQMQSSVYSTTGKFGLGGRKDRR